jgi:hypothetical protein
MLTIVGSKDVDGCGCTAMAAFPTSKPHYRSSKHACNLSENVNCAFSKELLSSMTPQKVECNFSAENEPMLSILER